MRTAQWQSYELLDTSGGERLERWGDVLLIRPDPQVLWQSPRQDPRWEAAHAHYHRSKTGGGSWEAFREVPRLWTVDWEGLTFQVGAMGFKHTGLFPEQAVNWKWMEEKIAAAGRPVKILNLFGYTGGATLACLRAGASVTHVDAAKGMVQWARDNARLSGLEDRSVRWLVDDAVKFVKRERRRGSRYDGILMDPPSYGRGPGGEIWRLEEDLHGLVADCVPLLSDDPLFFLLNTYNMGPSPASVAYLLGLALQQDRGGRVWCDEIGLPVTASGLVLPCGGTAIWER